MLAGDNSKRATDDQSATGARQGDRHARDWDSQHFWKTSTWTILSSQITAVARFVIRLAATRVQVCVQVNVHVEVQVRVLAGDFSCLVPLGAVAGIRRIAGTLNLGDSRGIFD